MKKPAYLLLLSLLGLTSISARADFSVNLDAGQLTSPASAPMQDGTNTGSLNGSLLLLIDVGASNSLSNTLTAGSYVSGGNTILAAGGFNVYGGTNETNTFLDITGSPTPGDDIALRWFPQITLSQYQGGTLPTAGEYFGTYDPAGGNPDMGDVWKVPSPGAGISLNFYTMNSDLGGTQAPSAGYAGSQVQGPASVPEPSSYLLLGLGVLALTQIRRATARR